MAKTRAEAMREAKAVLRIGSVMPLKPVIQSYGRGKNKSYGFSFVPK